MAGAPDDLGGAVALLAALPAPFIPERLHGEPIVAVVVSWTGDGRPRATRCSLRCARSGRRSTPCGPMPYAMLQGLFESPERFTARVARRGRLPHRPQGRAGGAARRPARPQARADGQPARPAAGRRLRPRRSGHDAARAARGRRGRCRPAPPGTTPAATTPWRPGRGSFRAALAPWWGGESWPNFIPSADPDRLRAAYGDAAWARLRAIRAGWDPDGVLGAGHAIPLSRVSPASAARPRRTARGTAPGRGPGRARRAPRSRARRSARSPRRPRPGRPSR